jgi:Rrf2 family protein
MKMSTKGRYGLRVMVELARRKAKGPVSMTEIARCQGVSRKYMHSLLAKLGDAGLVHSVRGAKGGFILARRPNRISAAEIVRVLEGPLEVVPCVAHQRDCRRSSGCAAQDLWRDVSRAMEKELSSVSLEKLASRQKAKSRKPKRRK